jgi:hypothetical protein
VCGLEGNLKQKDSEIEQMKTKITGLVKELVDKECFKNQVLANLSGLQKKIKENDTKRTK